MLWSKQFYCIDIPQWLIGDPAQPPLPVERRHGRNADWQHLNNADIIAMPDKWEYPWYAAWDLGFQCVTLAMVDLDHWDAFETEHPQTFAAMYQLWVQAQGVLTTLVWSGVVAFIAYKIVDLTIGLRVAEEDEREGLDISSHGETAYNR